MKARKPKMSKEQRYNMLLSFFLLTRDTFGGRLGLDGNYHLAGVSPVAGSIRDFFFILEKDEVAGSISVNTHLVEDDKLSAVYHIVLPSGDLVFGTFEELEKRDGKSPIRIVFDQFDTALLLLKTMKTKEGNALAQKFEPSDEEYSEMISVMEKRFGCEFSIRSKEETAQLDAIKARHRRVLKDYIYKPGDRRHLNDDEKLMITYLFINEAMEQISNPFRFKYMVGEIFPDDEGRPFSKAAFVDMESRKYHVCIVVCGPLNKAGKDEIGFACAVRSTETYVFFNSIQEALDSKYSDFLNQ